MLSGEVILEFGREQLLIFKLENGRGWRQKTNNHFRKCCRRSRNQNHRQNQNHHLTSLAQPPIQCQNLQPNKVGRTGRSYRNALHYHLSTLIHGFIACKPIACPTLGNSCPDLIPLVMYSISQCDLSILSLISYLIFSRNLGI